LTFADWSTLLFQAHSSVEKAALLAAVRLRKLPTYAEDNYSLTGRTLEAAICEDMNQGLVPFFVCFIKFNGIFLIKKKHRFAPPWAQQIVVPSIRRPNWVECVKSMTYGCTSTRRTRARLPFVQSIGEIFVKMLKILLLAIFSTESNWRIHLISMRTKR
jgi:hypothetical protein